MKYLCVFHIVEKLGKGVANNVFEISDGPYNDEHIRQLENQMKKEHYPEAESVVMINLLQLPRVE